MRDFSVSALALVLLIAIAFYVGTRSTPSSKAEFISNTPQIERVQSLGNLVVMKVSVADILTSETGAYRGAWIVKGDAQLTVDMRQARVVSSDISQRRLVIELPQPQIVQPRVDHTRTRTWEVRKTSWIPFAGDPDLLRDRAMELAQRMVEKQVAQSQSTELAKRQAVAVLQVMYDFVGWQIDVVWESGQDEPVESNAAGAHTQTLQSKSHVSEMRSLWSSVQCAQLFTLRAQSSKTSSHRAWV